MFNRKYVGTYTYLLHLPKMDKCTKSDAVAVWSDNGRVIRNDALFFVRFLTSILQAYLPTISDVIYVYYIVPTYLLICIVSAI